MLMDGHLSAYPVVYKSSERKQRTGIVV